MRRLRRVACAAVMLAAGAAACVHSPAARAAELAVYQGAGCDGVKRLEQFVHWFGRPPDRAIEFLNADSWKGILDTTIWSVKCWARTGLPMSFAVPMLPKDGKATLARGAAGDYDAHFRTLGRYLVDNGHASAIVRIGHEFNGDWFAWRAAADPEAWVLFWRRIVTVMRETPGQRFRFEWCPNIGKHEIAPDQVYPGDDVVDLIGLDAYNDNWTLGATPQQSWQTLMNQPYGLKWHREFAAKHGKPTSFPEWGTGKRPGGKGGGDDPHYIDKMAQWIASGNVAYHGYWDYPAVDYNARLSDGHQPRAAEAFLARFKREPAR